MWSEASICLMLLRDAAPRAFRERRPRPSQTRASCATPQVRRRHNLAANDARIRGRKGGRARKVNTLIACRRVVIPADQSGQILARVLRPSLLIEFKPFPGVRLREPAAAVIVREC